MGAIDQLGTAGGHMQFVHNNAEHTNFMFNQLPLEPRWKC